MEVRGVGAVQAGNIYIYIFIIQNSFVCPGQRRGAVFRCNGMTGCRDAGRGVVAVVAAVVVGGDIGSFSGVFLRSRGSSAADKHKETLSLFCDSHHPSCS